MTTTESFPKTILDKRGEGIIHKQDKPVIHPISGKKSRFVRYNPIQQEYIMCNHNGRIL